jgi:hypothetical protein
VASIYMVHNIFPYKQAIQRSFGQYNIECTRGQIF